MLNANTLLLERCPHCSVAKPNIQRLGSGRTTTSSENANPRVWTQYQCMICGGVILTVAQGQGFIISKVWPEVDVLSDAIPERARIFLKQAMDSLHAPSGAQILAASSVDALLKAKGYRDGVLNSRIKQAEKDHLITPEMALWAHEVKLDANAQRHADEDAPLPTADEAEKTIEFAKALAQFLFVLPAMVSQGRGVQTTP